MLQKDENIYSCPEDLKAGTGNEGISLRGD